jgi:hypothetical protein
MESSRALLIAITVLSIVGVAIAAVAVSSGRGSTPAAQQAREEKPNIIQNRPEATPNPTALRDLLKLQIAKIGEDVQAVKRGLDEGDIDLIRDGLETMGRRIGATPWPEEVKGTAKELDALAADLLRLWEARDFAGYQARYPELDSARKALNAAVNDWIKAKGLPP